LELPPDASPTSCNPAATSPSTTAALRWVPGRPARFQYVARLPVVLILPSEEDRQEPSDFSLIQRPETQDTPSFLFRGRQPGLGCQPLFFSDPRPRCTTGPARAALLGPARIGPPEFFLGVAFYLFFNYCSFKFEYLSNYESKLSEICAKIS
jgi:hypothetical protein